MTDVPNILRFKCKCVICGAIEYKDAKDIDEEIGPMCTKCMGPMTVERADVKVLKPGAW